MDVRCDPFPTSASLLQNGLGGHCALLIPDVPSPDQTRGELRERLGL